MKCRFIQCGLYKNKAADNRPEYYEQHAMLEHWRIPICFTTVKNSFWENDICPLIVH